MNINRANSDEEMRQQAIGAVLKMSADQVALILRVLMLGNDAVDAMLANGCKGYNSILDFVNEYENGT